jgi:negative regulator of flagellin synthesis FlgM
MRMDIRSGLEGLKSLLGTPAAEAASTQQTRGSASAAASAIQSDQATVSSAGSEISQMAGDSDVRMEKVAEIQAALASGSYNVPSSAVASKVVDAMLGDQS